MSEESVLEITVDGIDYDIIDEGDMRFAIMDGDENFAQIGMSECGEYYTYDYSPLYACFDNCSGTTPKHNHDSITEFFRWVVATCE